MRLKSHQFLRQILRISMVLSQTVGKLQAETSNGPEGPPGGLTNHKEQLGGHEGDHKVLLFLPLLVKGLQDGGEVLGGSGARQDDGFKG